jgi:hypothetical protein
MSVCRIFTVLPIACNGYEVLEFLIPSFCAGCVWNQVTKTSPVGYFISMNKSFVEIEAHRFCTIMQSYLNTFYEDFSTLGNYSFSVQVFLKGCEQPLNT